MKSQIHPFFYNSRAGLCRTKSTPLPDILATRMRSFRNLSGGGGGRDWCRRVTLNFEEKKWQKIVFRKRALEILSWSRFSCSLFLFFNHTPRPHTQRGLSTDRAITRIISSICTEWEERLGLLSTLRVCYGARHGNGAEAGLWGTFRFTRRERGPPRVTSF